MSKTLSDTTPEADAIQLEILRQMPVWRKLQLMEELTDMARLVALDSLRQQFPQASQKELRRLLMDRLLGPELAATVYGPRPVFEESRNGL